MSERRPSPNFNDREGVAVDMLVLHYTGMPSCDEALQRLCDPDAQVSAHYLIDEDGACFALVDEDKRAWHAGVASWRGASNINSRSIGIELVNPGHEFGYRDFPDAQMGVLIGLCREILTRYPIPAQNVVGHSDVAPTRKEDPGERFDWPRLAAAGIGLWPDAANEAVAEDQVLAALAVYGYDVGDAAAAVRAFQRHFRRDRIDGVADLEMRRLLAGLLACI